MGFDKQQIEAAALELLQEMEADPADAHEIQLKVRRLLNRMRATGMPVPEDLERLEQELSQEFARDPDTVAKSGNDNG